jgi:SAM-dependent methyltransferase
VPDERLLQREYYERTAGSYDAVHTAEPDEHGFALRHVVMYLEWLGAESVLDTGCGTGRAMAYIARRLPHVEVRGNDPSAALLDVAAETHGIPRDRLDLAASEELPYPDGSFDAVVETGILHHVAEPGRVVEEMLRVARRAVFLSDSNIYGQGRLPVRLVKLALARAGLFGPVDWLRRGGRRWSYSEGDGVAYSYSVCDALPLLRKQCAETIVIPTIAARGLEDVPLVGAAHALVCGFKEPLPRER